MADDAGHGGPACPDCGRGGRPASWKTVAAVSHGALPARQALFLCRTAGCSTLYFGDRGARVGCDEVALRPWFKRGGEVACFCFVVRAGELRRPEGQRLVAAVEERVRRGDCSCEVRNPTGRCCLPDLAALAAEARVAAAR